MYSKLTDKLSKNSIRKIKKQKVNTAIPIDKVEICRTYGVDVWRCFYCEKYFGDKSTIDHVIPLSKGGKSTARNTVDACYTCNQIKGDSMPTQYYLKKLQLRNMI